MDGFRGGYRVNNREKLHGELKEFIVNVGWTHKIHIVRADEYVSYSKAFKIVRIVLASLTSSGLIGILLTNDVYILKLVTALLSFATASMNGFDKSIDYDKLSKKEQVDANKFWELREDANSLLFDVVYETKNLDEIEKDLNALKQARIIYNNELDNDIPNRTVNKASKRLKVRNDNVYGEDYEKFISADLLKLKKGM